MLSIGLLIGAAFNIDLLGLRERKFIPLLIFALIAGTGLLFLALYHSGALASISMFKSFASIFGGVNYSFIAYNAELVAMIALISMLEIGLASGFGLAVRIDTIRGRRETSQDPADPVDPGAAASNGTLGKTSLAVSLEGARDEASGGVDEQGLRRDELSMMQLFLYGKVSQIIPVVDSAKPEGYFFEGIPHLDWDIRRTKKTLDSLARKGFLNAELTDKIVVCMACGSANVRIRKTCPECNSLRLRKEGLIEHFSCGAVEREAAFGTGNGDLVCPKCKGKLQLIGSDYRMLPPAYVCLGCNTMNSEPLLTIKCNDCGSTAQLDEEPEILLYKYTANPEAPMQELQQIKPLDACNTFFKSLGYTIVTPAFVSGRSGTQHLFDMLVLGRVGWLGPAGADAGKPRSDNGNTAVELLVSSEPVDLEDITRIYGKISDVDCDFLLFVIPGLTPNARNYAATFNMKVCEGKDIEEALASSKIPRACEGKA